MCVCVCVGGIFKSLLLLHCIFSFEGFLNIYEEYLVLHSVFIDLLVNRDHAQRILSFFFSINSAFGIQTDHFPFLSSVILGCL